MHTQVVIRRAEPDDAPAIWAAHRASILGLAVADYGGDQIAAWLGATPDDFRPAMAEQGDRYFVADASGDVVGFAAVRGEEALAVYVRPDAARQGIGTRLLDAVEREVRAHGAQAVFCDATLTAVPFYRANGYVERGRHDRNVRGVSLPVVRMTKDLRPAAPEVGQG